MYITISINGCNIDKRGVKVISVYTYQIKCIRHAYIYVYNIYNIKHTCVSYTDLPVHVFHYYKHCLYNSHCQLVYITTTTSRRSCYDISISSTNFSM